MASYVNKLVVTALTILALLFLALPLSARAYSARVEYVRKQLTAAGVSTSASAKLFSDKRLKLYPAAKVSYKKPDWSLIEAKLYGKNYLDKAIGYIASNSAVFEQAQKNYNVDKEVLAGVIAIETDFGRYSGNYSVFNALYSRMMRASSTKWKSQAAELVAFSKYCLNTNLDCHSIKGSYAGAFGIVQFMPSSVLKYGVDGDRDGIIDLSKPADAVPSAANFLVAHGWNSDQSKALARYYGSSVGYPGIVLQYAALVAARSE